MCQEIVEIEEIDLCDTIEALGGNVEEGYQNHLLVYPNDTLEDYADALLFSKQAGRAVRRG